MSHKQTHLLELRIAAMAIMVMTLLTISIFHLRKISQLYHNEDLEAKFSIRSLLFYSIPMLLCGVLFSVTALINDIVDLHNSESILYCKVLLVIVTILYTLFKIVIQMALCYRLIETFQDSYHVYSDRLYLFWMICIWVIALSMMTLSLLTISVEIVDGSCDSTIPLPVVGGIILSDFVVCSVNLYLFIRPLCALTEKSTDAALTQSFKMVIKKNAFLASLSLGSTLVIWIIIAATDGVALLFWQSLDCVVSSVSIVLLFNWSKVLFNALCCCSCFIESSTDLKQMGSHSTAASETVKTVE
eukprot:312856_1